MIKRIDESSRKDLVSKSRRESKKRFRKRFNYQITNFRGVDLFQLFEKDYFVFQTPVNEYVCIIAFPGVLSELQNVVKSTKGDVKRVNLQMVIKALRVAFDKTDDVKVRCTCADFKYRYMYWADKNGYLYGNPDPGTQEFPEKTNPQDNIGATCKHLSLFLSNKRWLVKAASVVNALIKAYPDKASLYLYDEDEIVQEENDDEVVENESSEVDGRDETSSTEENAEESVEETSEETDINP